MSKLSKSKEKKLLTIYEALTVHAMIEKGILEVRVK